MINIVLLGPEIAENTGNIGRTCVCTDSALHIIEPTKFKLTKEYLRRSGMDYWDRLKKYNYINYIDFLCKNNLLDKIHVKKEWIEKYSYIIDEEILSINEENCIRIPMYGDERSLNLANSVAIVLYEALRQQGCDGVKAKGELHRLKYSHI